MWSQIKRAMNLYRDRNFSGAYIVRSFDAENDPQRFEIALAVTFVFLCLYNDWLVITDKKQRLVE